MEAGLLELLLDVDATLLNQRQKVSAEPGDLGEREATFGDVDGLPGEMGRGGVAFGGGGVAVSALEAELEGDGADSGVDLERGVEAGIVVARQVGEELCGPGAAEAAVGGEAVVDAEGLADGEGDEHAAGAHALEVGVVLDTAEAVLIGEDVLADEDLMRADEGSGDDEAAAVVIEVGEKGGLGGGLFQAGELGAIGGGAYDADDRGHLPGGGADRGGVGVDGAGRGRGGTAETGACQGEEMATRGTACAPGKDVAAYVAVRPGEVAGGGGLGRAAVARGFAGRSAGGLRLALPPRGDRSLAVAEAFRLRMLRARGTEITRGRVGREGDQPGGMVAGREARGNDGSDCQHEEGKAKVTHRFLEVRSTRATSEYRSGLDLCR